MTPFFKALFPPALLDTYNKVRKKGVQWSGDYPTWEAAMQKSKGYDDAIIFEKVKQAALQVKSGKALYERDSVVFHKPAYSWELIANLLKIAQENNNELCVLDFGGAFGSAYFQNRKYFTGIKQLTWCIVEQAHFVDFGKANFENNTLKFYHTIEEVLAKHQPNVLLLLSVLQYLETPKVWIDTFKKTNIPNILIDRTAFIEGTKDRISLQDIPADIYKASYPAWFFNEAAFKVQFESDYELLAQSNSNVTKSTFVGLKEAYWQNFVFKKRNE